MDSNQFAPLICASGAHYCPGCYAFVLDCEHAVDPIDMPRVRVNDCIVVEIGYHRAMRILEVEDNVGAVYRYEGIPRSLAVQLVKKPAARADLLNGKRFAKVRRGAPTNDVGHRKRQR